MKLLPLCLLLFILPQIGAFESNAWAKACGGENLATTAPDVEEYPKEEVQNAVGFFVTERGTRYFKDNFEEIMAKNGYYYRFGTIPDWRQNIKTPWIGEFLKKWLKGVALSDPLMDVEFKDIRYDLSFSRFSLRIDKKASAEFGRDDAVILVSEVEVPSILIRIPSIRARDVNNDFLGVFGLNDFRATLENKSPPLRLKMPFLVETSRDSGRGGVYIQALGLTTNISAVKFSTSFVTPVVLPEIEVRINNRSMQLDHKAMEDYLLAQQGWLLETIQAYLMQWSESEIPRVATELLQGKLLANSQITGQFSPPKAGTAKVHGDFKWGVKLLEVEHHPDQSLYFGYSGFIEDTGLGMTLALPEFGRHAKKAVLDKNKASLFDMVLSLNQVAINRALQLSTHRGYFNNIPFGKSGVANLSAAPVVSLEHRGAVNEGRVSVSADFYVRGLKRAIISNPLKVTFDFIVTTERSEAGGIKVAVGRLLCDSMKIDKASVRVGFFESYVKGKVLAICEEKNSELRREKTILADHIPLPTDVFGIRLEPRKFESDGKGNLLMYYDYSRTQASSDPGDFAAIAAEALNVRETTEKSEVCADN